MGNPEQILTEYKAKIEVVTQQFLNAYLAEVPKDNRTIDTAGAFLGKHNDSFRKAVATIGVDMLHNHGLGPEVQQVVLENNSWAVAKLFVEVMNASSSVPLFGSKL
ncbi:hypothetical protein LX64_05182 [Chitinophaga skermanii]|uniref:Uncharacterized protein n=1 Tax=Chitinophaga skermanii TaxID=331697 RepID=A0A327Q184_9BACT|nr:hypothetical protein [Chitinophaga skermanii]RAI96982.1 hypothetical protein LX64_05182 [Chitinophaga skermanii]